MSGPLGMPALGLGTLNNQGDDAMALVQAALAAGYRHLDTAEYYGNEEAVGRGLAGASVARGDVWLTTKILHPREPRPATVRAAAEASLRRLGVDYVDALLIHWPNPHFDLDESLAVFTQLRDEGLTRSIGVSNFPSPLLRRAKGMADVGLNQIEYHPYLDQTAVLAAAREADVFIVAHSPLARGRVVTDPVLAEIAGAIGRTPAQVALRWLLQQDGVGAIPGGSPGTLEHLEENLGCLEFVLSESQMARIANLAAGVRIVDGEHAPTWDDA